MEGINGYAFPKVCPVLSYNNSTGVWQCQRREEARWEALGWWSRWCLNVESDYLDYLRRPEYLKCPLFSRWFWDRVTQRVGELVPGEEK